MKKTEQEIAYMREGGRRLACVLDKVANQVTRDVSISQLDLSARTGIHQMGGEAAFFGYRGSLNAPPYPATLCVSINDEVVHGVGSRDMLLQEGDIVGLDIGMRYPPKQGLYTDMAVTICVGKISQAAGELIALTKKALDQAIKLVRPGIELRTISRSIQTLAESNGCGVIRDLTGHGIGYSLHEDPSIYNYDEPKAPRVILEEGMTICIEPMITAGTWRVKLDPDGWTIRTADGSLAAHFEHTILVTKTGSEILTCVPNK